MATEHECECQGCGCDEPATTTDDGGVPVCEECADFTCDDGDVVCSRMTKGFSQCNVCDEAIEWGTHIQTGNPGDGSPNYIIGRCGCKDAHWRNEDRGGWGHYSRVAND